LLVSAATGTLAAAVSAEFRANFDAAHPRPTSIFYGLDVDSGRAVWANRAERTDAWTAHFLGSHPVRGTLPAIAGWLGSDEPFLQTSAPVMQIASPILQVLDDRIFDGERQVTLGARSARNADGMIFIVSGDHPIRIVEVEGRKPSDPLDSGRTATMYQC